MAVEFISWSLSQNIPSGAKFVLVALANRANQDGECWPSQRDIAAQTSMSERAVRRHISWLCKEGVIYKEQRRRANGSYTSDMYTIQRKYQPAAKLTDGQKVHQPAAKLSAPEPSLDNNKLLSEPSVTRAKGKTVLDDEFSIWYAEYPHKVGRTAAEKAFKKARKSADLQTLIEGVRAYIRNKPEDRAYCNPATWLSQGRWLDQPADGERGGDRGRSALDRIFGEENGK